MFRRKKYKIKFKKSYQFVDRGIYKEITDADLISYLLQLQRKYNFEIVSTSFEDFCGKSYIVIKCNKEDKNKIFTDYCLSLNGYIEEISF